MLFVIMGSLLQYSGVPLYKGLQGDTEVYKGLQGYTDGYTRVYKGLQGYKRVYKGIQGGLQGGIQRITKT